MNAWRETNLYEIIDLIGGGTPKTSVPEYWNGDIPWLSVADFNNGKKYVFETEKTITESGLNNSSTKLLNEGDIIISARGTVGVVAVLGKEMTFNQSCYGIRAKSELAITDYVYYLLKDTVSGFLQIAHGGVFDTITRDTFKEIEISLPPLPEQTAIASVLSSLDDKIDLLHRQNATLEKMAETLFRQWFVEEAKEDWELGKLSDLVVVKYGKDHKKLLDGKIPVFGSGGIMRYANTFLYNKESVLIPRKGTLNNVMYQDEPFWTVDTMFYTEMKVDNVAKYVYQFLKQQDLASMNVGSAVPSMTTEILNNMPIEIPNSEILHRFELNVSLYYKKIKSNQIQIRTLTSMRDTLLPKLMSGEVRVKM
jgi:type I restriction enzyme, S subunit